MTPPKKLIAAVAAIAAMSAAMAAVPNLISYQGRLLRSNGNPQTNQTNVRFRLIRGGDGTTFPPTGTIVYNELIRLNPTTEGIVSHLIGTGTAGTGCSENPCTLTAADFGDGSQAVWIEAMVDPDGTLNTSDDDVLLPRTRVGTVGYAYRVGSVDGAAAGILTGTLTADAVTAKGGATLGTGADADITLSFDRATSPDPTLKWDQAANRFTFSSDVSMGNLTAAGFTVSNFTPTNVSTGNLTATGTATFGNGTDADITLRFDRASTDPTLKWDQANNRFAFSNDVSMGNLTTTGFTATTLSATNLNAANLTAQNGATLGKNLDQDIVLRFDRATGVDPTLKWDAANGQFLFSDPVTMSSLTTDTFSTGTFDVRNFSTQGLVATGGATFGNGSDTDIVLRFDRAGDTDPSLTWDHATNRIEVSQGLDVGGDVYLGDQRALTWPTTYQRCTDYPTCAPSGTVNSRFNIGQRTDVANGQANNIYFTSYNYDLTTGLKINSGEPMFKEQTETSYWDPAKIQYIERNWDFISASGATIFRPFYFTLATGGSGAASFQDRAFFQFRTCDTCQSLGLNRSGTVGIGVFEEQSAYKLYVQSPITRGMSSQNGIKSLLSLNLDGTNAASFEYLGQEGVARASSFSASTSVGAIVGARGLATIEGTSVGTRTITQRTAGLEGVCTVSADGSTFVNTGYCLGGYFKASAPGTGTNVAVPVMAGVYVQTPGAIGAGTTVYNGAGVFIEDMKGHGTGNQGSIFVATQTATSSPGLKNNIRMAGGSWNNGHLQLNSAHIWWDAANGLLRAKGSEPTSESDGVPLAIAGGTSSQGLLKWGDGHDPQMSTGDQVCAASGLACQTVRSPAGDPSSCAAEQGPDFFYALCR